MSTSTRGTETERLAVPAADAAKILGISERHLWSLNSSGRLPRPVRFGRAVRWSIEELRAWLAAGAPERSRWESLKRRRSTSDAGKGGKS